MSSLSDTNSERVHMALRELLLQRHDAAHARGRSSGKASVKTRSRQLLLFTESVKHKTPGTRSKVQKDRRHDLVYKVPHGKADTTPFPQTAVTEWPHWFLSGE